MMIRELVVVALLSAMASGAEAYTLKQKSFRARDGSVTFACVTSPFEGTIAFVASERFPSGVAALVVPASNYRAFLRQRYPTSWYAAAENDLANGNTYTPVARQFDRETRKVPTVMFQAEGDGFGNFDRPHLPIDLQMLRQNHGRVEAAIENCRRWTK